MKGTDLKVNRANQQVQLIFVCAAIIQRVLSASVTVEKELISSIGRGVLVFAAVAPGDTEKEMDTMANKVLKMKLWDDDAGGRVRRNSCVLLCMLSQFTNMKTTSKWKRSVTDIEGEILCGEI